MNLKQPVTWIAIGLSAVAAVLGMIVGWGSGHWGTAAVALGLIVTVMPRFWNGRLPSHRGHQVKTYQLLLWHGMAAAAMAVTVLALVTSTSALSLIGASLAGAALVLIVVIVDIAERKRRHQGTAD